jgi:hypothetical protein
VHEVCERPLPVDLDDRKPLAVARLQLRVTGDVHLLELERMLRPHGFHGTARRRAQVALGRVEEDDSRDTDRG